MNNRLAEIIKYKTGGRQIEFAELMGWSASYTNKLLRGEAFGLRPVVSVIEKCPEINARWFLTGEGRMLSDGKLSEIRKSMHDRMSRVLDMEKYLLVMTPAELREFELAVTGQNPADFSPETIARWDGQLKAHNEDLEAKFTAANDKPNEICRQRKAKP
ncbi:hypothetical protein [Alistipes sp.]|uniref:hypothetical protein n=1 Tax=Alistipes sp. TaxID=1872444 RepID=UPI003528911F